MNPYVHLPSFNNYHIANLVLSLPPIICMDYIKENLHFLQVVLYEPLIDKDFWFNHLTIIILKIIISNSFNITTHAIIIIIITIL